MSLQENTTNLRKILNAVKKLPSAGGGGEEELSTFAKFASGTLTEITMADWGGATSIAADAFKYNNTFTSVEIGNSVTFIGEYAFSLCPELASVIIGNSVTTIDDYAFYSCSSLTSVVIGSGVTKIGIYAFSTCSSLTNLVIGNSITSILKRAFFGCGALKRVDFSQYTKVPTLGSNAFNETHEDLQIKVPANLIDSWKSATNWANLADRIVTEFTNEL